MQLQVVNNNRAEQKISLGSYDVFFEEGMLCIRKSKNFFIFTPKNFGLSYFSIMKLVKINERCAYIICDSNKLFLLKIKDSEEGEIKIKELSLPFEISQQIECAVSGKNILLLDFKNNKYAFIIYKRGFISGEINLSIEAKPFIVESIGIIFNNKEVHIIKKGLRSLLLFKKMFNVNNLIIKKEKAKNGTIIYLNDGTYEGKILIEKDGNIIYGEKENIFFVSKID